jgi:hypothetical protein
MTAGTISLKRDMTPPQRWVAIASPRVYFSAFQIFMTELPVVPRGNCPVWSVFWANSPNLPAIIGQSTD